MGHENARESMVSVRGLRKQFGARQVVADLSFDLATGEIFGLIGPNGAGKTTTLRMIAGLMKPSGGSGVVLGHDLISEPHRIADRVGYMPQALGLYETLTVAENLRFRADVYGLRKPGEAVVRAMAEHGLTDRAREPAGRLSGGWARRLQFAASLIHRPRLVLLDEPTAGLDIETRRDVWRRIVALAWSGVGVIVNTHDLLEAEQCGRVAVFSEGRILAIGAPSEVASRLPIETLVLTGAAARELMPTVADLQGVLSVHAVDTSLSVLALSSAAAAIERFSGQAGIIATRGSATLEDVTIALMAGVRPREAAT